jgi:hypothetical protein
VRLGPIGAPAIKERCSVVGKGKRKILIPGKSRGGRKGQCTPLIKERRQGTESRIDTKGKESVHGTLGRQDKRRCPGQA